MSVLKKLIKEHRKKFPGCPGTRDTCIHWSNYSYVATFDGFTASMGNIEAFDEETARAVVNEGLARNVPFEVITLEIKKA